MFPFNHPFFLFTVYVSHFYVNQLFYCLHFVFALPISALAAQTAESRTNQSLLMQHWVSRLGIQLYHESLSCLEFSLLIIKVRKSQNMSQSLTKLAIQMYLS